MKKTIILIILTTLLSLFISYIVFKQYKQDDNIIFTSNNTTKYYFLSIGSYNSYDDMIKNTNKLYEYIYNQDNNIYYVYICLTKDKTNLSKIEGIYKDNEYITSIREYNLSNKELDRSITSIDLLLNNTSDPSAIKELCKDGIQLYKEG